MIDCDFRSRGWWKPIESGPHYDATLLKVVSRFKAQEDTSLDDIAVQFDEARFEARYQ